MIPHVAHFYWGNKELPYLRFLTLKTFAKQNPGWKIKLYIPLERSEEKLWKTGEHRYEVKGKDYFSQVRELGVETIVGFSEEFNSIPGISEVHKSDLLRWKILSGEGGLWSDMDIIYFKPLPELIGDNGICIKPAYGHSIGFLYSSGDSDIFRFVLDVALSGFNSGRYQSAGADVLNRFVSRAEYAKGAYNIPMGWVYPIDARSIGDIYRAGGRDPFTEESIGLHWYAGSSDAGEYINSVTEENQFTFDNVLGKAIRRALL